MEAEDIQISELAGVMIDISSDDMQNSQFCFGTVTAISAGTVTVMIDGAATSSQLVRACNPAVNDRVVICKKDTIWICFAVIGGCPHGIGDIIHTENPVHPSTRWAGTTWVAISGKTLFGYNATETEFDAVGKTGGAKVIALTTSQMPSHSGHVPTSASGGNAYGKYLATTSMTSYGSSGRGWQEVSNGEALPVGTSLGSGEAHNNMPPYSTVHIWKRTG